MLPRVRRAFNRFFYSFSNMPKRPNWHPLNPKTIPHNRENGRKRGEAAHGPFGFIGPLSHFPHNHLARLTPLVAGIHRTPPTAERLSEH